MDGLSTAASIIAVIQITGTVIQYLGSVKGAPKERQRLLIELSNVTGILLMLKDQAEAENDESWNATFRSLNMPNGPLRQFHVALETLASKLSPVDGLRKISRSLMWPFQEKEIRQLFSTIESQKALFNLARQNDHIALTKALKDDVMGVRSGVDDIGKGIAQIQTSHHHERILNWLCAPDPSPNYNNALKARLAGTGAWFIQSSVFLGWISNPGFLLWLYGIPGCGKTVLSSTVIQHVLSHCGLRPSSAVLYYYFSFNESEKQRPENMIRSLVTQLHTYQTDRCKALDSLYDRGGQPTNEELLAALHQMMIAFDEIFVVLDALDECAKRSELLTDIEEIMRWKDIHLHFLTTSRKETDIEESLESLCDGETKICIQSAVVNADIRSYVHNRLLEDRRFKRWQKQPKVQLEIENDLMEKAGGMFRWAVCQLDTLGSCLNLPQLRKALQSLPKDLDSTYERILCNIDDMHHLYALKILQWLTFSARPLALEEIAEVVAIEVDEEPRFDPERRLPDPRDVMTICSSLITIDGDEIEDDLLGTPYTPVRLAHFSVKEYLVSDRILTGNASVYSVHQTDSNTVIAEDCLAYLLHFDRADVFMPRKDGASDSEILAPEDQREFPLALYAAKYWTSHAQTVERNGSINISSRVLELLRSKKATFENWMRLCGSNPLEYALNLHYRLPRRLHRRFLRSPLHYVSLAGLPILLKMLLEQGYDANAKAENKSGQISALSAACMGGHLLTVKTLLDNGAVIGSYGGGNFGPPLYEASYGRQEEVVRLLIDNGADVNAQEGLRGTALQKASERGHRMIVQLLLDNGADVNTQGGEYGNALQAAIRMRDFELAQLLLEKGADVNAQGGEYGNALQAAIYWRNFELVQLLLEKGADVNAQGGEYGNPLQAALAMGKIEIVQLLLEKGADVNAQGGELGNALQAAASRGSCELIQLLIEEGANVNAQGGFYGNALQAASVRGISEVVQLLIGIGVDVNTEGGCYGNALQAASAKGGSEIVQLLIEKGADMSAQGGYYGHALQAASTMGETEVVQLLVEKGADVNAHGGEYGRALQAASTNGRIEVVQLLIENGADVNARGRKNRTALREATRTGRREVIQLLLDNGAIELDDASQSEGDSDETGDQSEDGSDGVEHQSEKNDSYWIEFESEDDSDAIQ